MSISQINMATSHKIITQMILRLCANSAFRVRPPVLVPLLFLVKKTLGLPVNLGPNQFKD